METTRLLQVRKKAKKVKPEFTVRDSRFMASIKKRWRLHRGKHSPVRQKHRGRIVMPNPGYGSPKEVRGLDRSGLEPVVVHNLADLVKLNKKTQGAVVGSTVGGKKKLEILAGAQKNKVTILNVKDPAAFVEKAQKDFAERLVVKKKKQDAKKTKDAEKKKKAEEKKKEEEKVQQESKKESPKEKLKKESDEQKEIMQKTITKKN